VERTVEQLHADVAKLPPEKAAIVAHEAVEAWQVAQPGLANLRRAALRTAIADGWTQADLASLLGVTRQRIHQLMGDTTVRGPRPAKKPHTKETT
jgi:hypothetical protein